MKMHERRATGNVTYYKLAVWDKISMTWRDGKKQLPTRAAARAAASKPGLYRISTVIDGHRSDGEPFTVE